MSGSSNITRYHCPVDNCDWTFDDDGQPIDLREYGSDSKLSSVVVVDVELLSHVSKHCPTELLRTIERLQRETKRLSPQWRVFDKDDESTWPPNHASDERCWTYSSKYGVNLHWFNGTNIVERLNPHYWESVTHWMPIEAPSPPSSLSNEGEK